MYQLATPDHLPVGQATTHGIFEVADNLTAALRGAPSTADLSPDARKLIQRVLDYAAEAQQTISDQQTRIRHLEELSTTDELTGLLNRRGFNSALDRVLDNAKRYRQHGILVAIDLDGFKPVNDIHGHAAGDELLNFVADFLRKRIRATDYLARIGGDEFAIIMVNGELAPARARAMEVKEELNKAVARLEPADIPVRASFGVAPFDGETTADQVLCMADVAMYHDKRRRSGGKPEKLR